MDIIPSYYFLVIGAGLSIVGAFLSKSNKSKISSEVPIYHKGQIVGYRRE